MAPEKFPPRESPPYQISTRRIPPSKFPPGEFHLVNSHAVIFHHVNITLENSYPVKNGQELQTYRNNQLLQLAFIFANGIFLTSLGVLIFANCPM